MAKKTNNTAFTTWLEKQPKNSSKILMADPEVALCITEYLKAFIAKATTRSLPSLHEWLIENYNIKFSISTLKRYCRKFEKDLWNAYKETQNS